MFSVVVGELMARLRSARQCERLAASQYRPGHARVLRRDGHHGTPVPAPLSQRPDVPIAKPAVEVAVAASAQPVAPVAKPVAAPAPVASHIEPAFSDDDIDIPEFLK